jgi:small-conductance mechanosensitive channel
MNKELEVVLLGLSKKLGISIDMLWSALIKQAYIDGITNIILYILGIFLLMGAVIALPKLIKIWGLEDLEKVAWILMAIPVVIYVGCFFCIVPDVITALCNPEYWALKDILCQF